MKLRYWLALVVAVLTLAAGAAMAAIPGSQRALCPQCFGLTDIGGGVFTDAPDQAGRLRTMVAVADREIDAFLGGLTSAPRYVLCVREACDATFGGGSTGLTLGWHLIRISARGERQQILTHERLHAELAARAGVFALVGDPVPVWFNEGLASYLARDDRFPGPYTSADTAWVMDGMSREHWNRLLGERDWIAGYGAAQAAVAALEQRLGRDRLRAIVQLLIAGETLPAALIIVGG